MDYKYVVGLINALGFQNVLKVDFTPKKTCNFDCVYCSVGRTTIWLNERKEYNEVEDILHEIQFYLKNNDEIKYMMLTGSGEPALFSGFGKLVKEIKKNFPEIKIMAYTNCSLLPRKDVVNEFLDCDILGCNLNAVYDEEFKKICRPINGFKLKDILDGLLKFKKIFKGIIFVDSKFVAEMNDTSRNLNGLIEYLSDLKPDRYTALIHKHKGKSPSEEFTKEVNERISKLPFTTNFVN
ncbi:MAG TPA: radical SAM protein [Candidatus Bathyarchaeia archaeon]|nr:radical SAM protein [Candidatus Bathyarchaeia archaeon]